MILDHSIYEQSELENKLEGSSPEELVHSFKKAKKTRNGGKLFLVIEKFWFFSQLTVPPVSGFGSRPARGHYWYKVAPHPPPPAAASPPPIEGIDFCLPEEIIIFV